MNLAIFLTTLALHVPIAYLAKDKPTLEMPELYVSYILDEYTPMLVLSSDQNNVSFEVKFLTPYGMDAFREVTTESRYVPVYGASCHIVARAKIGDLVSDWSKPVWASDIKTQNFFKDWRPIAF